MSLHVIVKALGGDLYDQGRRANVPAPGHDPRDRSVSLLLENGRVVVHTFGDGDWRAVLDHLRALGLIDTARAPLPISGRFAPETGWTKPLAPERKTTAARLWSAGRPIVRTPAERHCRLRGVLRPLPGPQVLRFALHTPIGVYRPGSACRPAMLAAISAEDGGLTAVEITYLEPGGGRAHDLRLPRKTVGLAPGGCAVRLDPPGPTLVVGEGVFTTLSASERFGLPAWALLSTRNLSRWRPPEGVRRVLIAADRGEAGESAAGELRRRLVAHGVRADTALPPAPDGDWNEWACARRRTSEEEVRVDADARAEGRDDPCPARGSPSPDARRQH